MTRAEPVCFEFEGVKERQRAVSEAPGHLNDKRHPFLSPISHRLAHSSQLLVFTNLGRYERFAITTGDHLGRSRRVDYCHIEVEVARADFQCYVRYPRALAAGEGGRCCRDTTGKRSKSCREVRAKQGDDLIMTPFDGIG
jgi:hypothetical protein